MKYDRAEAIRYFGAKPDDVEAKVLTDIAYLKLRNEVRPKYIYRIFDCVITEEGVLINGEEFKSRDLAKHLQGCEQVALMAATLGSGTDVALRRIALQNIAEGAAAQAVCAALVETLCDDVESEIKIKTAVSKTCSRFSPGYGDWDLTDQPKVLRLIDADRRIGLSVTESNMLAPIKSVTAIVGLNPENILLPEACDNKCLNCPNINCLYRKE